MSGAPKSTAAATRNESGPSPAGSFGLVHVHEREHRLEHLEHAVAERLRRLGLGVPVVVHLGAQVVGLGVFGLEDPDDAEAAAALHEHVHGAVVQLLDELDHARRRPALAHGVVLDQYDAELALLQPLPDELLVALLEDVQRDDLSRQQHDAEREQAEKPVVSICHATPPGSGCRLFPADATSLPLRPLSRRPRAGPRTSCTRAAVRRSRRRPPPSPPCRTHP